MGHTIIRRLLAPLIFFISVLLSAQALADFDVGGFSYGVISGTTTASVEGCDASPCASKDIAIPAAVVDGSTTYSVAWVGFTAFIPVAPAPGC